MTLLERIKGLKHLQKIVLVIIGLIVLYTVCGFLVLPPIFKSILQKDLSQKLHRQVTIRTVATNPYVLSLTLKDLTVRGATPAVTKFASFKKLYFNFQLMSLFKGALIVEQLKVTKPYLKVVRTGNEAYNFSDLMHSFMKPGAPKSRQHTPRFSVDNIEIQDGTIDIWDQVKHKRYAVKDIVLHLPFISDLRYDTNIWVKPLLKANVNGSTFSMKGKTKPFAKSRQTIFNVALKDIALPAYLKYSPVPLQYRIPSGKLSVSGHVSFLINKTNTPVLKFKGDIDLTNLQVKSLQDSDLVKLPRLKITIADLEPLARKLLIADVSLHEPEVHLRRNQQGKINLLSVPDKGKPQAATPAKATTKTNFSWTVQHLKIDSGKIFFTDDKIQNHFQTTLESLNLTVKNLGNTAGSKAGFQLATQTDGGARIAGNGNLSLNPVVADGTVRLTGVPISRYAPYYDKAVLFKVRSGKLDCRLHYQIQPQGNQSAIALSGIQAQVSALQLQQPGKTADFFAAPSITISNGAADFGQKRILIGTLQSANGTIVMQRDKTGKINLEKYLASSAPAPPAENATRAGATGRWNVTLKNGLLQNYQVHVNDFDLTRPMKVTAQKVDLTLQNIGTTQTAPGHMALALTLPNGGSASLTGKISTKPLAADLKIDLQHIDITPFQAYFPTAQNILLTSGKFSAEGNLLLNYSKTKGFHSSYVGKAAIDNITTVAAATRDDLINWKKLTFSRIDAGNSPLHFNAGQITLANYYAHLWINSAGKLNVFQLLPKRAPQTGAAGKPHPAFHVKIAKVVLQDGRLTFDDQFLQPHYQADLMAVGGTVQGLDSAAESAADVALQGTLANSSPFKIDGKINPFQPHFTLNLKTSFDNISLIPMNPFAREYIGYTIDKGKLSLHLNYRVEARQLNGQNQITLDQLSLGREVHSSHAIDLPIKFAISLLKNRQGNILLNIPISGDLNAPHFSLRQVVGKAVQGLLGEIVSSPFSFLGSLVGGGTRGEELKYVQFPYGESKIGGSAAQKLDTLAAALYQRPNLELDIAGHVDPVKDKAALQTQQLITQLKKLAAPGKPLQQVTLTAQEYSKYLRLLYAKKHPRATPESIQKLSTRALKTRLLSRIKVTNHDLRSLAYTRATQVEARLLKSGKIAGQRIFIVRRRLAAEPKPGIKASRVTLALK